MRKVTYSRSSAQLRLSLIAFGFVQLSLAPVSSLWRPTARAAQAWEWIHVSGKKVAAKGSSSSLARGSCEYDKDKHWVEPLTEPRFVDNAAR